MANRFWNTPSFQLEKGVVRLYAHITFGASGAPTLVTAHSKGFTSVTKNATGKYTLQFGQNHTGSATALDTYYRVLSVNALWDATGNSGTAPTAPLVTLIANAVGTAGSASFQLTTQSVGQTATSPASGEGLYVEIHLSNSNTPS